MATPKPASSRNGALWVIALSLVVIAACLVLMVIHYPQDEIKIARPDISQIQPAAPNSGPVRVRVLSSHKTNPERDAVSEAASPENTNAPAADTTQPAVVPAGVGLTEISSGTGLAPLSFLGTNDGGTITGKVKLIGTPPPETPIQLDAVCGKLHKTPITTHRYVVSKDGGLANVFVYIQSGLPNHTFPTPSPAVLNQVGCEFQPAVLGLMAGQHLVITNSDPFFHNVDAMPQAFGNQPFNIAQGHSVVANRQFAVQELPVRIKCDVHPWMHAYAWVVDHPFFAITDSDGNFTITNVPPGNYKLRAFHFGKPESSVRAELAEHDISVSKGEVAQAKFFIELPDDTKQASR